MTLSPPTRKMLRRESLYLLGGIVFGFACIPAIGTVYYREDIAIGYRQFLGALVDPETCFRAVAYILAPYLLAQLLRFFVRVWHALRPRTRGIPARQ